MQNISKLAMIYLIGGTARSGKSTLLHKIIAEKGCIGLSTDLITQMLDVGMPELDINFKIAPNLRASRLSPLIKGICTYHTDKIDLVIEGEAITPENYSQFHEYSNGHLKMICIGTSKLSVEEKARNIRNFPSYNEWTHELNDQEILDLAKELITNSQKIEKNCKKYNIPYFDTSNNFLKTIEEARQYLLEI